MTITADTATQLDALADTLSKTPAGSADLDAQMLALVAPVMLTIDGRTAPAGFRYTLNITNALQLRAKHWFSRGVIEIGMVGHPFASTAFEYVQNPGEARTSIQATSVATIGLATAAAVCKVWAQVVRMWLGGLYPLGVTQPSTVTVITPPS
jgi:hypothetical protein